MPRQSGDVIPSPCKKVCAIDPVTGWCSGCGRTTDEIADWFFATDREKQAILAKLPSRRHRLAMPRR